MARTRCIAQATAIFAVMIGIGIAAFALPTSRHQDAFTGMLLTPPSSAPALRAQARGECGLLLPIQRVMVFSDFNLKGFSCFTPFGLSGGGFASTGDAILHSSMNYHHIDTKRGVILWLVFLVIEGAGGLFLYRTVSAT